ncbi:hypothetical protein I553_6284 [Mycobacterium xenopi 4042]|uniref:Uncharacterized protein n=1 Tax=Mycobacterium xenopi 4042 TaxID=1299334 RepID=X8BEZ2_MYCXE|nr:hypothetical protein I553_6284 [Mycobacterium xenopi 4042]
MQPEDGASLRITKLGEAQLAILTDGDVALELGTRDRHHHGTSVSRAMLYQACFMSLSSPSR